MITLVLGSLSCVCVCVCGGGGGILGPVCRADLPESKRGWMQLFDDFALSPMDHAASFRGLGSGGGGSGGGGAHSTPGGGGVPSAETPPSAYYKDRWVPAPGATQGGPGLPPRDLSGSHGFSRTASMFAFTPDIDTDRNGDGNTAGGGSRHARTPKGSGAGNLSVSRYSDSDSSSSEGRDDLDDDALSGVEGSEGGGSGGADEGKDAAQVRCSAAGCAVSLRACAPVRLCALCALCALCDLCACVPVGHSVWLRRCELWIFSFGACGGCCACGD
jgi:hypothetical protein